MPETAPRQRSEPDWERANCINIPDERFFSDSRGPTDFGPAKKVCELCVIREDCLEYALSNRIKHGVWGGKLEEERLQIIKQRTSGTQ